MKVFFDTNVLLAAFATRGLCADLFAHVLVEHELLVGEFVLRELRITLRTKLKLAKKTQHDGAEYGEHHPEQLLASIGV